jgi:hypothetical protein
MHPEVAFLNNYANRFPTQASFSLLNFLYEVPVVRAWLFEQRTEFRGVPSPTESWQFWEELFESFRLTRDGSAPRPRRSSDIQSGEREKARERIGAVSTWQPGEVFVAKYTDFARCLFLDAVFPKSRFIHLIRDGRAVAYSYMSHPGFNTWEERDWWIQGWREQWVEQWYGFEHQRITFFGFQWRMFLENLREELDQLEDARYASITYEDFTADAWTTLQEVFDFIGVGRSPSSVRRLLEQTPVRSTNYKWREQLSSDQIDELEIAIGPELEKLGYS